MKDEYELVTSPLSRQLTDKGLKISVEIYRGADTEWTLEVVDELGNSTVWDDLFASDESALNEALRTVREEGIETLVGPPCGSAQ